jgi:hypothetical protein
MAKTLKTIAAVIEFFTTCLAEEANTEKVIGVGSLTVTTDICGNIYLHSGDQTIAIRHNARLALPEVTVNKTQKHHRTMLLAVWEPLMPEVEVCGCLSVASSLRWLADSKTPLMVTEEALSVEEIAESRKVLDAYPREPGETTPDWFYRVLPTMIEEAHGDALKEESLRAAVREDAWHREHAPDVSLAERFGLSEEEAKATELTEPMNVRRLGAREEMFDGLQPQERADDSAARQAKVACCPRCREWFPTWDERNAHRRQVHRRS